MKKLLWIATVFLMHPVAAQQNEELDPTLFHLPECGVKFHLANVQRSERKSPNEILLKVKLSGKVVPFFAGCYINYKRTSKISDLKTAPALRILASTQSADLDTVIFVETKQKPDRVIRTVEGYFADRDYEYRFIYVLPDQTTESVPAKDSLIKEAADSIEQVTASVRLGRTSIPTITELEYRRRLKQIGSAGIFLLILLSLWIYRRREKKKAPPAD